MQPTSTHSDRYARLIARLRHLLLVENYYYRQITYTPGPQYLERKPSHLPLIVATQTIRHLIALGGDGLPFLRREFPELETLHIGPVLCQLITKVYIAYLRSFQGERCMRPS